MTFLVPFDDSALSRAALARAESVAAAFEHDLVVLVVLPDSRRYAVRKGWLDSGEPFDAGAVAQSLETTVTSLAPGARFEVRRVDSAASAGTVARVVRQFARSVGARMVFIGSENAGRIVTAVTSVGSAVAADAGYDVHIVRSAEVDALAIEESVTESGHVDP